MKATSWKTGLLVLAIVTVMGACREYPTRPRNRNPHISSVVVFPTRIGVGDSTLITIIATDPDADTLVYDWETDSRLIIKGTSEPWRYNTFSNSQVFYRSASPPSTDTAWVECDVRDRRGGMDARYVRVFPLP